MIRFNKNGINNNFHINNLKKKKKLQTAMNH